ncbi:hypothetical protein ACHAXA_006537, partial [Cyclostephanos tholiformis]
APGAAAILRPVIFVVNATTRHPPTRFGSAHTHVGHRDVNNKGDDEPYDVIETSTLTAPDAEGNGGGSGEGGEEKGDLYCKILLALQGEKKSGGGCIMEEEISLAASHSCGISPVFPPASNVSDKKMEISSNSASHFFSSSPFSRLSLRRWSKASSPRLAGARELARVTDDDDYTIANAARSNVAKNNKLVRDMEYYPHDDGDGSFHHFCNVSAAVAQVNTHFRENPPVNFFSNRARIVSVSSRHAFPPSKFPRGKMDPSLSSVAGGIGLTMMLGEQQQSGSSSPWISSYDIQNEGILPSGWLEKHAGALPSAILVITTLQLPLKEDDEDFGDDNREEMRKKNQRERFTSIKHVTQIVENLRETLPDKRVVALYVVCLLEESNVMRNDARRKNILDITMEMICQKCQLPRCQVVLLQTPKDLEAEEFESGILRSPYLDVASSISPSLNSAFSAALSPPCAATTMINPLLRELDRSLRDSSSSYYSSLAEAQERKLILWRNRYHSANVSFEVNTLLAAMRCARYAIKVGTLREFQIRTGSVDCSGLLTDNMSSTMRHYDEAYQWVVELHRRAISWRATALTSSNYSSKRSLAPITPGGKFCTMDDMSSPKVTESPGGGIGVELSLLPIPGGTYVSTSSSPAPVPPPPPSLTPMMRRSSPALTSKEGYSTAENIAFFASLWEQCRAVAHIVNAKLLRSSATSSASDDADKFGTVVEQQWCRHRFIFMSEPQGVPNFQPSRNDDFFGPVWHRFMYVTEELLTYACIAEERWHRTLASKTAGVAPAAAADETVDVATSPAILLPLPSYHQPGAPWKVYCELSEAVLGLRRAVLQQSGEGQHLNKWISSSLVIPGRRKFVGSIACGDSGSGTISWQFENELKRDHQAIALGYVLHALDLLDEHLFLCPHDASAGSNLSFSASENPTRQPISSARLHYVAGRLLMSLDDPTGASVHLKIASAQTKLWPSLHLSIRRALSTSTERYAKESTLQNTSASSVIPDTVLPNTTDLQCSCIELLLLPDSGKLLSPTERIETQMRVWPTVSLSTTLISEVIWTHNDTCKIKPPLEFAVSFLNSTHAASSDVVTACVSIKSRLSFQVVIKSMKLLTTSGTHDVDRSLVLSWMPIQSMENASFSNNHESDQGILINPNEMALFITELSLPSNLSHISVDGTSTDAFKFIPKNGRLCNMGFSRAAGNICESRFENLVQQNMRINGEPIDFASISEASPLFHGGVPFVCYGVVLTLERAGSNASLKIRIESPYLISPLRRSGTQRSLMEETNYTSFSWFRPAHHPWCLGPRVLRLLGPRPRMTVTNITGPLTDFRAVKGTVNRILLHLKAGIDVSCWDVRVSIKCTTLKKVELATNSALKVGSINVEPQLNPTFVHRASDPAVKIVTENGVALPSGWEPRKDVGSDESHSPTTSVSPHIGARKSFLFPLDIFYPLDQSLPFKCDAYTSSTSYEVTFTYRQVRSGKRTNKTNDPGDHVVVMLSGIIDWISPLTGEFFPCQGPMKLFPCGIQNSSNMRLEASPEPTSAVGKELIAADGDSIRMRCSLEPSNIGCNVAAAILRVTNKVNLDSSLDMVFSVDWKEKNEREIELYSSDSTLFRKKFMQGSKLSLSYSVLVQDNESGDCQDSTPLGTISVDWKPASLYLRDDLLATVTTDEFGSAHGPLSLPGLTPIIFHGPPCQVLPSLFKASLVIFPSAPKVGTQFCISYRVTNQTAESQTLVLHLNYDQVSDITLFSSPQLLGAGKLKDDTQIGPYETKTSSFTFVSMVAGKVCVPALSVYSCRHQA